MDFNKTTMYKLHQLVFCIDQEIQNRLIKHTKISYVQYLILLAIEEYPDFTQQQIAHWANLTKSAVSQNIEKMVITELLTRNENPLNRREKIVKITQTGYEELKMAKVLTHKISQNLFSVLNPEQEKALNSILDTLVNEGVNKV